MTTAETRRRGRPVDADGDATRRRCVEAAIRVFAAAGYAGTGMRTIAQEAGVTASALYNYFSSKADLYADAWADALEQIYSDYAEAVERKRSLGDEFDAILDRSAVIIRDRPWIAQLALRATVDASDPELGSVGLPVPGSVTEFYDALIERALARQEIRPGDGAHVQAFLAVLLWGICSIAAPNPAALDPLIDAAKWAARGRFSASGRAAG